MEIVTKSKLFIAYFGIKHGSQDGDTASWLKRHITAICEKNHNKPNISIKRLDEATEDIKYMIDCVTDKEYPNNN
ncbi:MAG: hypothetical protein OSJ68_03115 [Clostridia bacterium]|nr:hypothetical protein [Clostridia bacterium]